MDPGLVLLAATLVVCLGGQTAILVSLHRRDRATTAPAVDLAALAAFIDGIHSSVGHTAELTAKAIGTAVSTSLAPPDRPVSRDEIQRDILHELEQAASTFDPTSDADPTDGWLPRDRADAFMAAGGASGAAAFGIGATPPADLTVEYDPTPDIDGMPWLVETVDPDGYTVLGQE